MRQKKLVVMNYAILALAILFCWFEFIPHMRKITITIQDIENAKEKIEKNLYYDVCFQEIQSSHPNFPNFAKNFIKFTQIKTLGISIKCKELNLTFSF